MNGTEIERIAALEWANYAATQDMIRATPASNLLLRDDVVITSARLFPVSDANHACLLRATPETADTLIAEIIAYFKKRRLPLHVFLSPACTPADLADRLLARGFKKQEEEEAWIVIDNLPEWQGPAASTKIAVTKIDKRRAFTFAWVYLTSFEMPAFFAPFMFFLLRRSMDSPNIHYYLASVDGKPVGACLWYAHQEFACLGAAGVLPRWRGTRTATSLGVTAVGDAQRQGMKVMMAQTINPRLERFMRIHGFRRAFTRTCYSL